MHGYGLHGHGMTRIFRINFSRKAAVFRSEWPWPASHAAGFPQPNSRSAGDNLSKASCNRSPPCDSLSLAGQKWFL